MYIEKAAETTFVQKTSEYNVDEIDTLFPDVVGGVLARGRHGLVDGGVEVVHVEQGLRCPQSRPRSQFPRSRFHLHSGESFNDQGTSVL